jgi:hypothetical protein
MLSQDQQDSADSWRKAVAERVSPRPLYPLGEARRGDDSEEVLEDVRNCCRARM